MEVRTIEARTHGRYLVRRPVGDAVGVLVGFHGYREHAEMHLERLRRVPGADPWLIVSVQGLHRFYTRGGGVVASWMTREDREHAIADNVDYVGRVLAAVQREFHVGRPLVFVGFSQGTAMAFRAAAHYPADGLIAVGADVPPELSAGTRVPVPPVLYGRGSGDELYSTARHAEDLALLARLGAPVQSVVFDGGHNWTDEFGAAAGIFLVDVLRRTAGTG